MSLFGLNVYKFDVLKQAARIPPLVRYQYRKEVNLTYICPNKGSEFGSIYFFQLIYGIPSEMCY